MARITDRDLYATLERLQAIVGPTWTYSIDGAYGGHKLVRTRDGEPGQWSVTDGYVSKRELYNLMHAMITGIQELERGKNA